MNLVTFYFQDTDQEVIGFKILPNKEAKKYKKAVKALEENGSSFSFGSDDYDWNSQNIQIKNITAAQIKTLNAVFSMDYDNGFSKTVGFIPDAVEQAYEEGLTDQNGNPERGDDFEDDGYQEQDY